MPSDLRLAALDTPVGRLWLAAGSAGLRSISRADQPGDGILDPDALAEPLRQLTEYFRGTRRAFDLELDFAAATPFTVAVWRAAMEIPYGQTASYAELAMVVGAPRAARAVGGAMAQCPIHPVVPCHRVIHADGTLGGWGTDTWVKRWYLRHEADGRGRAGGGDYHPGVASMADVARIAASLPGTIADADGGTFRVGGKLYAWTWQERVEAGRRRVPNPGVLVIRVADELEKEALLASDPLVFFTEPHYDGYAAVLVRLEAVDPALLETLITDAWRLRAQRRSGA